MMIGLPVAAFFLAPSAGATSAPPGANLAGINASSFGTGVQVVPLVKGVVPAGNLSTGNFVQVSIPYSQSTLSTGPTSNSTSTPVWPGPVAATLSNALPLLGFPQSLANLLKDPVIAQADFPPQPSAGASGSYAPPAGSATGVGTANAKAGQYSTSGQANLSSESLAGGMVKIASSTATSSTSIGATSVLATAHSDVGHVSILGGLIDIASISSDASATSDGNFAQQSSGLKIGAVSIDLLGHKFPVYIGPNGLHLVSSDQGGIAVGVLNTVLTALNQAGLTITTVEPSNQVNGNAATVDSGVVEIGFVDANIPNPQGQIPVTSAGFAIDLGESQASAQATTLPPLPPFTPPPAPTPTPPVSTGLGAVVSSLAGAPSTTPSVTGGQPVLSSPTTTATAPAPSNPAPAVQAAVFGVPIRVAWVVIAVILSIIAAGPLLGYANWQLLRGRRT